MIVVAMPDIRAICVCFFVALLRAVFASCIRVCATCALNPKGV